MNNMQKIWLLIWIPTAAFIILNCTPMIGTEVFVDIDPHPERTIPVFDHYLTVFEAVGFPVIFCIFFIVFVWFCFGDKEENEKLIRKIPGLRWIVS